MLDVDSIFGFGQNKVFCVHWSVSQDWSFGCQSLIVDD